MSTLACTIFFNSVFSGVASLLKLIEGIVFAVLTENLFKAFNCEEWISFIYKSLSLWYFCYISPHGMETLSSSSQEFWTSPQDERLLLRTIWSHALGFVTSGGKDFQPGSETWLIGAFCVVKFYSSIIEMEKASDTENRRRKKVHPC